MVFFYGLLALVVLEIAAFIAVGDEIGVLQTIVLCFLSAVIGTMLVAQQGMTTLVRLKNALDQGLLPVDQLFDGICLMMAGFLLILPGFVSDALAFALLVPPLRHALRTVIARRYGAQDGSLNPDTGVIEGEFVRIREDVRPIEDRNL